MNDHAAAAGAVTDLLTAAAGGSAAGRRLPGPVRRAGRARRDPPPDEARRVARAYGDRAMEALRQATAEGFKDGDYLKKADFEPLRLRDDFKRLEDELGKK